MLFDLFEADLDGDGLTEGVLIFNDQQKPYAPGVVAMSVAAKQTTISPGALMVTDLMRQAEEYRASSTVRSGRSQTVHAEPHI
jgi:hypothetical protein